MKATILFFFFIIFLVHLIFYKLDEMNEYFVFLLIPLCIFAGGVFKKLQDISDIKNKIKKKI